MFKLPAKKRKHLKFVCCWGVVFHSSSCVLCEINSCHLVIHYFALPPFRYIIIFVPGLFLSRHQCFYSNGLVSNLFHYEHQFAIAHNKWTENWISYFPSGIWAKVRLSLANRISINARPKTGIEYPSSHTPVYTNVYMGFVNIRLIHLH